jgi:hypothetical protein
MSNGERADLGQQLSVRGVSMGSMGKRTKKKGENGRGKTTQSEKNNNKQ